MTETSQTSQPDQHTAVVWGTGYGSRRHALAPASLGETGGGRRRGYAQCDSTRVLTFFDADFSSAAERERVAALPPCSRCLTRLGHTTCPTCFGLGTLPAPSAPSVTEA